MENINSYKDKLKKNEEKLNSLRKEVEEFEKKQKRELHEFEEKIGYLEAIRTSCDLEKKIEKYYEGYLLKVYNLLVNTIKDKNLSFYRVSEELEKFDVFFNMMCEENYEVESLELYINEEKDKYSLYLPDDYCDIEVLTIASIDMEKTFEIIENYLKNLKKES